MTYEQFIYWLNATPVSRLFKNTEWVVPTVQSIHILAIGVVVAVVAVMALRLTGLGSRHVDIVALSQRLIPPVWWALAVLFVTGVLLVVTEPTRTLANPFFLAKLLCLLVVAPVARAFQLSVRRRPEHWRGLATVAPAGRAVVAAVVLLLLVIIACGRWIAYA